jgi:hypothetical protein
MSYFFVGYIFLYCLHLSEFVISVKVFDEDFDNPDLGFTFVFFYILLLDLQEFVNIARLYFNKDFSAVLTFIIIRIELITVACFIVLSRNFYLPIIFTIFNNCILLLFFYLYWIDIYSLVLRSYAHRLGSDVEIKNIYIFRTLYNSMKTQSFVVFIFLLFISLYLKTFEDHRLIYVLMAIPVFFIKVLEREEENEDSAAKFINLFLLLCLGSIFVIFTVLYSFDVHKGYIEMLLFINSYHFLMSFLLGLVDYFNFGSGLKEALSRNKVIKEGRKMN